MLKLSPDTRFIDFPIANSDKHLQKMLRVLPFEQGFGARRILNIGCDYSYSGRLVKGHSFDLYPPLAGLISKLNDKLGTSYNGILINHYPAGTSVGIGMHTDNEPDLVSGSTVCSLSLGATVDFMLEGKGERIVVPLTDGSVFLMGQDCQKHYRHGIAKTFMRSDRISLTFREFKS